MSKLLLCPVAILSAAVLISIGCNRSGDNGESAGVTPPAANRPEGAGSKAGASEKTAIETPPGILPGPAPLAGANGAKLKPLEFSMPAGKAAPLDEIEPKPLFKPLPIETTKKIAAKNPMPASPLVAKAADEPVVSQKPREVGVGGRVNPLRANSRPALAKNPIRAGGAKQPQALQPLPDKPLPQKPAGVLSEKKVDSSPAAKMPAAKMPAAKMPEKAAPKFDPIKVNGPIFEGWTKPKLAIVITGREDGYLEPCGCAGLDSMKGGMSRRHTMIESLRKKGWPLLCVDVGGLSKGYGVQAELKFQITVDAMKKMGYEAIGFSPNDLRLPVGLLVAVADDSKDNPSPFVSADVGLLGFDADITAQWRVVDVGGIKVGVTSVLGKDFAQGLAGDDIEIEDPESALARIVPELKKRCKLMILLAYATVENSSELSKKFPEFAVVATAGGPPSPPAKPTIIKETKALLIEVGEKGMDAIVLGLYANEKEPYRYQRVPLDSRFKSSKDMKNLMVTYQDRLRTLGLEGLAIKPVMHSDQAINGEFVGSKACEACHEASYDVWKKSGHAKAWDTLLHTDPPRDADPECISCHVVGWHPTKHFPYKSGFLSEKTTPKMLGVGCESCHGPGGQHVKAEMGSDKAFQSQLQKAVRVTTEDAKERAEHACQNCHDLDNSPDFNFDTYWPKVMHKESE